MSSEIVVVSLSCMVNW